MKLPGPQHPIAIEPARDHVVIRFAGEIVADTRNALALREASYPAVLYIPRADARLDYFSRTSHSTHCPYKGDASYYSLAANGKQIENAVWSYETPYPAMAEIKDHIAFYPQYVSVERNS